MAEKGLGRGLNSLLGILERSDGGEKKEENIQVATKDGVEEIEIGLIDNNPNQPRKNFDPVSLNELADSIRSFGVVQPIILKKINNRYMIVAGERRFRASKIAGLKKIPAIIKDYSDQQVKEIALLENIQREDLNPIEYAKAVKELMNEFGWTQDEISDKLGKSRSNIANVLRLLTLCPAVISMVESGKLSAGHARSLVVVQNPEVQEKLAKLAIVKRLTVRDMEKAVKEVQMPKQTKEKSSANKKSIELMDLTYKLEKKFSTKVDIKGSDNSGKIVINYNTKNDLERIFEVLDLLK